ncbi:MAG TPA: hypothetical protein VJL07_06285 [Dehalococcoidia bacterium]|nr:hypothetical protein [Dehalococcoidia bacterium]
MSASRVAMRSSFQSRFIPALVIAFCALAVAAIALLTVSAPYQAGAQSCQPQLTIDFSELPAGTIIGEQYAASGVHISGAGNNGGPDALIVFDSNSTDTRLDQDLRVGIGNIAILANNLDDGDGDGLVDKPDENNLGGRAIFTFDQDVTIGSFRFVDKDHGSSDFAIAYDAAGAVLASVPIPQAGNGSVQTIAVNADGVRRFELVYRDSGGFTGIEVKCEQAGTPTPAVLPAVATPVPVPAPVPIAAPVPAPAATAVESAGAAPAPAVLSAAALPSGGGEPSSKEGALSWPATLLGVALVVGGSFVWMTRARWDPHRERRGPPAN